MSNHDDELYWRKWRNSLSLVPIYIQGEEITLTHFSFQFPINARATAILTDGKNFYIDVYRKSDGERLVLEIDRISKVETPDQSSFASVLHWVIDRIKIPQSVAQELGLVIPSKKGRS